MTSSAPDPQIPDLLPDYVATLPPSRPVQILQHQADLFPAKTGNLLSARLDRTFNGRIFVICCPAAHSSTELFSIYSAFSAIDYPLIARQPWADPSERETSCPDEPSFVLFLHRVFLDPHVTQIISRRMECARNLASDTAEKPPAEP